jgi:hypothetical protein
MGLKYKSRVAQVRGPHGQVLVRGVEVPLLGPGKAQIEPATVSVPEMPDPGEHHGHA